MTLDLTDDRHEATDAAAVAAIERRHELVLLDRLLEERARPVPPPPALVDA